jgi:hypothetical protein
MSILKNIVNFMKNIWISRIYLCAIAVCIVVYSFKYKEKIVLLPKSLNLVILAILIVANISTFLYYTYIHYSGYKELNVKISYWQTFQIVASSRLGVYIPGKVWFATNYYIFSRRINVEPDKIGKNFIINNALLFFTGAFCTFFAMTKLSLFAQYLFIILPVLMIVLIHPKVLNKIFLFLVTKISQIYSTNNSASSVDIEEMPWDYLIYLKFIMFYLLLWLANGTVLYLSICTFRYIGIQGFPVIISAAAASLIIGLLALFAPSGVGVREGVGTLMLSQIMSVDIAALAFILLRLSQFVTDVVVGVVASISLMKDKNVVKEGMMNGRN